MDLDSSDADKDARIQGPDRTVEVHLSLKTAKRRNWKLLTRTLNAL